MKAPLLVGLLCAASVAVRAEETPAPAKALTSEAAAEAAVKDVEVCLDNLQYFRADLQKKEAELDKEFKGKVPSAFVFLMNLKRGRVTRQQEECAKLIKNGDAPLAPIEQELKALPGDSPEYTKKRKVLDALRERMNKTFRVFSTPPK